MPTALVTGTSKGLGLELARALLARDFRVLGVARSDCPIEADDYRHLAADITAQNYPLRLREFVDANAGRGIDILVNNAGSGGRGTDIENIRPADLRSQLELHCIGALQTIQTLQPWLRQAKIVNITSRLGSIEFNQRGDFAGQPFSYSYRIAKAAQNMLSLCLRDDAALSGNLVISVIPGLLRTDSGAPDANRSAAEGGAAVLETILRANHSGIYHAFADEAAY